MILTNNVENFCEKQFSIASFLVIISNSPKIELVFDRWLWGRRVEILFLKHLFWLSEPQYFIGRPTLAVFPSE